MNRHDRPLSAAIPLMQILLICPQCPAMGSAKTTGYLEDAGSILFRPV